MTGMWYGSVDLIASLLLTLKGVDVNLTETIMEIFGEFS
jgi:hypothetical protein